MKARVVVACALVALFMSGCPATGGMRDAGETVDAGDGTPEGTVTCSAGHDCSVGTHCDGESCAAGCFLDTSCRGDEFCWGVTETTTGQCRLRSAPACGDGVCERSESPLNCSTDCADCSHVDDTGSACGSETCPTGRYCTDPASGTCAAGCTSQSHCGCGTVCVISPAVDVGSCENPYANPDLCNNGVCDAGETLATCPEDCQDWAAQCNFACERLDDDECFAQDADAFACYQRCDSADETQQEAFASCVGTMTAPCPLMVCLMELPE